MAHGNEITKVAFREILYTVFRHKWRMLSFFLLVTTSSTVAVFLLPEVYQSEAAVLVRPGRENMSVDPSVLGPMVSGGVQFQQVVDTEASIIRSQDLAERVVDLLGTAFFADGSEGSSTQEGTPQEGVWSSVTAQANPQSDVNGSSGSSTRYAAVRNVMTGLNVEVEANTISLTYDARSPLQCQMVLAKVIEVFLERHIEINAGQAAPEVFEQRLAALSEELARRECELEAFCRQNELVSNDTQEAILLESLSTLEAQLSGIRALEESSAAQLAVLEESLAKRSERVELSSTGTPNAVADSLRERLLELRLQEKDLASRYPDTHRPLIELRAQIAEVDAALLKEPETLTQTTMGLDANYQSLQLQAENSRVTLAGYRAQREALEQELKPLRERLEKMTGFKVTLTRLTRNVQSAEGEYMAYRESASRAKASAALDEARVSNVSVVQQATLPMDPIKPRKARNIMLGLFVAFIGAIGLACILDYCDDTFKNEADVERVLGVSVVASVPEEEFRACT